MIMIPALVTQHLEAAFEALEDRASAEMSETVGAAFRAALPCGAEAQLHATEPAAAAALDSMLRRFIFRFCLGEEPLPAAHDLTLYAVSRRLWGRGPPPSPPHPGAVRLCH